MAKQIDKHVGARVRAARKHAGMSQTALADRLGVTFQQVQKYEAGTNRIGAGQMFLIARALNLPLDYFYEGADGLIQPFKGAEIIKLPTTTGDGEELARLFKTITDPVLKAELKEFVTLLATPFEDEQI